MAGELVFGLIPSCIGLVAVVFGAKGDVSALFLVGVGAAFGGIGVWMFAAPWRYCRMLQKTVYAVTSRRVIILRGLLWGSSSTIQTTGSPVEVFERDRVELYEIVGNSRDIALGGHWKRGRKGRQHWVHTGLLAADDPIAAENALRCLLANNKDATRSG